MCLFCIWWPVHSSSVSVFHVRLGVFALIINYPGSVGATTRTTGPSILDPPFSLKATQEVFLLSYTAVVLGKLPVANELSLARCGIVCVLQCFPEFVQEFVVSLLYTSEVPRWHRQDKQQLRFVDTFRCLPAFFVVLIIVRHRSAGFPWACCII